MIVTMLWRVEGSPAVTGTSSYSDVKNSDWFAPAVIWGTQNGIVTGGTDGNFAPDLDVTREQLAAILYRYARYKGQNVDAGFDLSSFADAAKVTPFAVPALRWACAEGIVTGATDSRGAVILAPLDASSRVVVATMLMRFCEKYGF